MSNPKEPEHTGRVIRDEVRIDAPAADVYRAWTDPDTITGWFVSRMEGRAVPGETISWLWDDGGPGMSQRVLIADEPHRLVTAMELPQGVSYLEVTIHQEDGYSVVRLVQSGFGEGPEWDDEYEGMLSGWMMALAVLKWFAERHFGRRRREILVLADAPFDRETVLRLQRGPEGPTRWLALSGSAGDEVGAPVQLELTDGRTLSGRVLRATRYETLWSWDEIEGVVELKAFRSADWGSKVGVRISTWLEDASELADLEGWLAGAVAKLAGLLRAAAG